MPNPPAVDKIEFEKILDATWRTTDGRLWNHSDIDAAVDHELALMESEGYIDETV